MPDYFVPLDTTKYSRCYREMSAKSIIINANLKYIDANRKELRKSYPTFKKFREKFQVPQALVDSIMAQGEKQNIKPKDDAERQTTQDNIRRIINALVVDEEMTCGALTAEIRNACRQVCGVELFDIYRGAQLGEGKKSMAFKIAFAPEDKALTPEELDRFMKKILGNLKFRLGAEIR